MDEESRIKALEDELRETKEELKEILLDIRTYLMETQTPIPNDMGKEKLREELQSQRG
jgi:flagellar basal body-associated protein FliL